METNELMHYGVKGMKWGVHKDQKSTSKKWNKSVTDTSKKHKSTAISIKSLKEKIKESMKRGAKFITNNQHRWELVSMQEVNNFAMQEVNNFAMQETIRASINASLQAASLSASSGHDPFRFGGI